MKKLQDAMGLPDVVNGVLTPMSKEAYKDDGERPPLGRDDASAFRSWAARVNYVAQDRPDLSLAACVLASKMACPRAGDDALVKRVARFMLQYPEASLEYKWQEPGAALVGTTDSDWAADPKTRISKSGGTVTRGLHLIAHWCKQEDRIALSSGEAELKASCKCLAELLEVREVMDFLTELPPTMQLHLDAQATEGMLLRQGAGKLKHLTVRTLWVQAAVLEHDVKVIKLPRALNHADVLCSFHIAPEFHEKLHSMGLRLRPARGHRRRGGEDEEDEEPQVHLLMGHTTRRQTRAHRLLMMLGLLENGACDSLEEQWT